MKPKAFGLILTFTGILLLLVTQILGWEGNVFLGISFICIVLGIFAYIAMGRFLED